MPTSGEGRGSSECSCTSCHQKRSSIYLFWNFPFFSYESVPNPLHRSASHVPHLHSLLLNTQEFHQSFKQKNLPQLCMQLVSVSSALTTQQLYHAFFANGGDANCSWYMQTPNASSWSHEDFTSPVTKSAHCLLLHLVVQVTMIEIP